MNKARPWRQVIGPARHGVAPLYLFVCIILGGSDQASWRDVVLAVAGIAIIAWAAAARKNEQLGPSARRLLLLSIVAIAIIALQTIPFLPSDWSNGPRSHFAAGYHLMGRSKPLYAISITPSHSLRALLAAIPPLAIFCAIALLRAFRMRWLLIALLAAAAAEIIGSGLEVALAQNSPWYHFPTNSFGAAAGFFASRDHMAGLLMMTIPFIATIAASADRRDAERYSGLLLIVALLTLSIIGGIALSGSLVGYGLVVPVIAGSALIVVSARSRFRTPAAILAALLTVGAILTLTASLPVSARTGQVQGKAAPSRHLLFETTERAIVDYMPLGSGVGSFASVYSSYEHDSRMTNARLLHVSDDYAEIVLELGLPGIALVLLFMAWWVGAVRCAWQSETRNPFAKAASLASGAILVQSLVDFPLRTTALSTCFAMCIALLAERRQPRPATPADFRPARHLVYE